MREQDRPRFGVAMHWLAGKYPLGREKDTLKPIPRQLNAKDLADYFAALSDVSIDRFERGVKWHFAHHEFFPERPATLRKSIEAAPPPPRVPLPPGERKLALPMSVERQKERLQEIFDELNRRYETKLQAK